MQKRLSLILAVCLVIVSLVSLLAFSFPDELVAKITGTDNVLKTDEDDSANVNAEDGYPKASAEDGIPKANAEDGTPKANAEDGTPKANAEDGTPKAITEDGSAKSNAEDGAPKAITEDGSAKSNAEDGTPKANAEDGSPKGLYAKAVYSSKDAIAKAEAEYPGYKFICRDIEDDNGTPVHRMEGKKDGEPMVYLKFNTLDCSLTVIAAPNTPKDK